MPAQFTHTGERGRPGDARARRGGSIAGLSAAQVLRRLGVDTVVLERSDGVMLDRGAGLGLDVGRLRAVRGEGDEALPPCIALQGRAVHVSSAAGGWPGPPGRTLREPGALRVSSWQHLYEALRGGLGDVVQAGVEVTGLALRDGRWQVATRDGRVIGADLLVGADGHRSVVRRHLDPQAVPQYAGYLLWRGMVEVDAVDAAVQTQFLDQHLHLLPRPGHHMVVYEVPPARPGGPRRLNWGWYVSAGSAHRQALVQRAGMTDDTLVVPPPRLHAADRQAAVALAAATWPAPWSTLVAQTAQAGGLFVNAVHEFVAATCPDAPVALLGDAAHLLSPITGSGAGMAMQDALALGQWLSRARHLGDGGQQDWTGLGRAMAEGRLAAQRALTSSRAWAAAALGADVTPEPPCRTDLPQAEEIR